MRKKLFVLALLMFIFAFQFSTSCELAFLTRAYKYGGGIGGKVVDWGRYSNVLLGWWVFFATIILLTLYYGTKQPKTACKIKSPVLFTIGLLMLAPFFILAIPDQIQFATTGVLIGGVYEREMDDWVIPYLEELFLGIFSQLHVFCWFIGTTLIFVSLEAIPIKEKQVLS